MCQKQFCLLLVQCKMWKPKDIFGIFLPVMTLWKILGLPSFELKEELHTKEKKLYAKSSIFSSIIISFVVAITIIYNIFYKGINKNFKDLTTLAQLLFSFLNHMGMFILCHRNRNLYAENISKCDLIRKTLEKHACQNFSSKEIIQMALVLCVPRFCLMCMAILHDIFFYSFDMKYVAYISEWFYSFFVEILLIHYLLVLNNLYLYLKNNFKVLDISICVKMQYEIQEVTTSVFKSFEKLIVLRCFADFTFISVNAFYTVYNAAQENNFQNFFKYLKEGSAVPITLGFDYFICKFVDDIRSNVSDKLMLIT